MKFIKNFDFPKMSIFTNFYKFSKSFGKGISEFLEIQLQNFKNSEFEFLLNLGFGDSTSNFSNFGIRDFYKIWDLEIQLQIFQNFGNRDLNKFWDLEIQLQIFQNFRIRDFNTKILKISEISNVKF